MRKWLKTPFLIINQNIAKDFVDTDILYFVLVSVLWYSCKGIITRTVLCAVYL